MKSTSVPDTRNLTTTDFACKNFDDGTYRVVPWPSEAAKQRGITLVDRTEA